MMPATNPQPSNHGKRSVAEFGRLLAEQRIGGEGDDQNRQHRFGELLMAAGQQQKTERNAEDSGGHQPSHAADVDLAPVLGDDNKRNRDRDQDSQRRSDLDPQSQGQQWNG